MALLHRAELTPSKTELIDSWAPGQPWFAGERGVASASVGAFRFDDPEGEVGVETLLIHAGVGPIMQIPLTYRGAPLDGAEAALIGTMQHSVLGKRWVYDGAADPVYILTTATAALSGGHEAALFVDVDGERVKREPTAIVHGSGSGPTDIALPAVADVSVRNEGQVTVVETTALVLAIRRVLDGSAVERPAAQTGTASADALLSGTWGDITEPQPLVRVASR
ncbi:hypothetical protein BKA04_000308 [Cryobacterium mesophilum]|uniref:CG0192-related protein n=1 Tax=Terrimesophilobacter mesophilus TaxID=433647 RepID=UPI00142553E1|nr:hypothetical protein [Terrimesophilobacter mesophilus]MBB5632085.1 hypothetical protein [Terrimesophilobacter mesophilus]